MKYFNYKKECIRSSMEAETLTEDIVWQHHDHLMWNATEFKGTPNSYPIYRYKDFHSFSLLALIFLKAALNLNPRAYLAAKLQEFSMLEQGITIDLDNVRLVYPIKFKKIPTTTFKHWARST